MNSSSLTVRPGELVGYQGKAFRVHSALSFQQVVLCSDDSKQTITAPIHLLTPPPAAPSGKPGHVLPGDLKEIPDADWDKAQQRFDIIRPLLVSGRTRAMVEERAKEKGVDPVTLYRWIKTFGEAGLVSALIPSKRRASGPRLEGPLEELLTDVVQGFYLTSQRPSVVATYAELTRRCRAAGLKPPHCNTLRNRIGTLSQRSRVRLRLGRKAAEAFRLDQGNYERAETPLSVVQIDHTPMDILLVDERDRQEIGRPWLTLAIDVFSRMVLGFYVSLDPPSSMSVGLCLAHAILPKETWMARLNVTGEWPCWGKPGLLHMDNAKEFRGEMLRRACTEYAISIHHRPVKTPHYGGHIERMMGSVAQELHLLPGTTFSNPRDRGEYNSKAQACMTLAELEKWLATWITGVYHQRLHSGIETTPLARWRDGLLGNAEFPGIGLPPRLTNETRVRLDFMPFVERTVQGYGVVVDDIHYWHDCLRQWVNASDPDNSRLKRQFIFRRDPRDLSCLWFYDPQLTEHVKIPYRNAAWPGISSWELKAVRDRLRRSRLKHVDEAAIFAALAQMREIQNDAARSTRSARRWSERRRHHARAQGPASPPTPEPGHAAGASPADGFSALPQPAPGDSQPPAVKKLSVRDLSYDDL